MIDQDGYPTEEALKQIEQFDLVKGDVRALLALVRSVWRWPDGGFVWKGKRLKLITGGWSGNEDVIEALGRNFIFWSMYWESSHKGGLHKFRVPEAKP